MTANTAITSSRGNRKRPRRKGIAILGEVVLFLFIAVMTLPLLWCFLLSVKTQSDILLRPLYIPPHFEWSNYTRALEKLNLSVMLTNTLVIAVVSISAGLLISFLASYAIARMRFGRGRLQRGMQVYFMSGMIVPIYVMMLPIYLFIGKMHLLDTRWALIIPYVAFCVPMSTMILVAGFKAIPEEIEESAIMDGCGLLRIIFRILGPLMLPSFSAALILQFVRVWNDFPMSSIMLISSDKYTIALAASQFQGIYSSDYALTCAALTLLLLPQLAVFAFLQKYMIAGLTVGAVKG